MSGITKVEGIAETAFQLLFNADNLTAERIGGIRDNVLALAKNFDTEITRVRDFKIDIHWKSRVINVPSAIDKFKDLFHELTSGLRDKVIEIARPFETFVHDLKLLAAAEEIPDPQGGPSRIATAFSKLEEFITQLNILVGQIDTAIKDASDLTQLFDRVLKDIEHLDDLFLSQKSARTKQTVTYFKRA
jgi:transcription termination factor NusB